MEMDWVSFLTDPMTLASGFAALAVFATVMTIAAPAFSGDKLAAEFLGHYVVQPVKRPGQ